MTPYYADEWVTLYHGDCRDIMPDLRGPIDLVIADPPYGETALDWDRWPHGWLQMVPTLVRSLWCFGSMRSLAGNWAEFTRSGWQFSQDVVWEKHNGSGFASDRFKRVHENATHWYRGMWSEIYHETPTTPDATARQVRRKARTPHAGDVEQSSYTSEDGGPRLMRSVLQVRSMHGRAIHPTEKPVGIVDPLIRYGCKPGGTVLDPCAGSGSTAEAARQSGRLSVLIEAREHYCELIANRMSQGVLVEPLLSSSPVGADGEVGSP